MHGRCLLQFLFALSSLILSKARDVLGSGPSCVRSSPADDGQTRVTFLREDAAGARSLYLSVWSEDMRPVACEVNANPLVTERYRALCEASGTRGPEIPPRLNISVLLAPDAPCALGSSGEPKFTRDGTEAKTRRKRSWIFPGTLWCGTGSQAARYEQLGMFESADKCCREHDHCAHIIRAFSVNYGVFNSKFFTVSHCDCDARFRQCLLGVNDTISSMVGYSFFNILQVPCFELKQQRQCTEMYLFGGCKAAKKTLYAVFKSSLPYSDVTSKVGNNTDNNSLSSSELQNVTESPVIKSKSTKSEHRCSSRDQTRGDTFYRRRKKGKGCKRHQKLHTVAPSPISRVLTTSSPMKTSLLNASTSSTLLNKTRAGKWNSTRNGHTQRGQVPPHVTTNSYPQTTSTTISSSTTSTEKPTLQLRLSTATTAVTHTTKSHRKAPKQKTTETPKQNTLKTLSAATSTAPVTTKLKPTTSVHKDAKPQNKTGSHVLQNNTEQEPIGRTQAPNTHAGKTDSHLLCGSLKHLDECKYKIPPLEKNYDLQNMESKTAYHCDCTSRLALQIASINQPSTLPTLLMDFVSHYCFKLAKEKKCPGRKSCSGGFTKASDLLQALKKIEEKDTAGVRNSRNGRKRGIPVRLYKRCLRLEREADIMAPLTRL